MSNRNLIIGLVIMVLLVVRLVYTGINKGSKEREWFIDNLNYEFTAVIDSVAVQNNENGFFTYRKVAGTLNRQLEDSLNRKLEHYKVIRFLRFYKNGRMMKGSGDIRRYAIGDSIHVSSAKDLFLVTRKGETIWEEKITHMLRFGGGI